MKRIKSVIKFLFIFSFAFLTFILSILLTLYLLFPEERIRSIVLTEIKNKVNRKIEISNISMGFSGIEINNLKIYDKNESRVIFKSENAVLFFSPLELLNKRLKITELTITRPALHIDYKNDIEKIMKDKTSKLETSDKEKKDSASEPVKNKVNLSISSIKITNGSLTLRSLPEKYKKLNGKFFLSSTIAIKDDNLSIKNSSIVLPQKSGKIEAQLLVKNYKSKKKSKPEVSGTIKLKRLNPAMILKTSPPMVKSIDGTISNLLFKDNILKGNFFSQISTEKNEKILLQGSLKSNFKSNSISLGKSKIKFNNSFIEINRLSFNTSTFKRSLKVKVDDFHINIDDLKKLNSSIPSSLYGSLKGKFSLEGSIINGNLFFNEIKYAYKNKNIISNFTGEVAIKNNQFFKESIPLKILNQKAFLSISAKGENFSRLAFNIYMPRFNYTPDLFSFNKKKISGSKNSRRNKKSKSNFSLNLPMDIFGKIKIDRINYKEGKFLNNTLTFKYKKNVLSIPFIKTNYFNSVIQARAKSDLSKKNPRMDITFKYNDLKVQKIDIFFPGVKNRLFGLSHGRGKVNFNIKNISQSLEGNVLVQVKNGKMINTGIQNKLILVLKPLKYKLRDIEFKNVNINISLKDNTYNVKTFLMESRDIKLRVSGKFDKKLKGRLNYNFEFNNNFIKDLPNPTFLTLNIFRKGKWYILKLKGDGKNVFKKIKLLK